jgi:hypothetical protein
MLLTARLNELTDRLAEKFWSLVKKINEVKQDKLCQAVCCSVGEIRKVVTEGFDFLTVELMKIQVLWGVTLCFWRYTNTITSQNTSFLKRQCGYLGLRFWLSSLLKCYMILMTLYHIWNRLIFWLCPQLQVKKSLKYDIWGTGLDSILHLSSKNIT